MDIGTPELLIILLIVLLLFGVGRLAKVGSELGKGIREFRRGLQGEEELASGAHSDLVENTTLSESKDLEGSEEAAAPK